MLKSGNGDPKLCAENLVLIVRGEVPFDRVRGIDSQVIDGPAEDAKFELEQDALWNIENYEPRLNVDDTEIDAEIPIHGDYLINIHVSEPEEDDEE